MKLHKTIKQSIPHRGFSLHKNYGIYTLLFFPLTFALLFFVTRGLTPNTSEMTFVEYSVLGKEAGSVVPASCDSSQPFNTPYWNVSASQWLTAGSHWNGDCLTPCPGVPASSYDPYYDPSATTCPTPTGVRVWFN